MLWDMMGAGMGGAAGASAMGGAGMGAAGIGLGPAAGIGIGMGVLGSVLSHMDAKKQAAAKQAALAEAMRKNKQISQDEAMAQYKAGGISQGELLKHLQRLVSTGQQQTSQQHIDDRQGRIEAMAGAPTATGDASPTGQVAQAAIDQGNLRSGLQDRMGLAQALLGAQDRGRAASSRTADVSASRAVIPLQERLYKLAQDRMQTQANLQNALGNVGPGWGGIAGGALSGMSSAPFMFA